MDIKYYKDQITVHNYDLHSKAELSISQFLDKMEYVKALRAQWEFDFTLYPTSQDEVDTNHKLWEYVQGKTNTMNIDYIVFGISFPKPVYNLLKFSELEEIDNMIALYLACMYAFKDEETKVIMKKQIYPPVFKKAMIYYDSFFATISGLISGTKTNDKNFLMLHKKAEETFAMHYKNLVKTSAMYDEINPFSHKPYKGRVSFMDKFDIKLPYFYMTEKDWTQIIINGSQDSLQRVESSTSKLVGWLFNLQYHFPLDQIPISNPT